MVSGVLDLVTITSLLLDGMGGWLGAGEGKRVEGGGAETAVSRAIDGTVLGDWK